MFHLPTKLKNRVAVTSFKTEQQQKTIQCIHTYSSNSLSVVMVNVFAAAWVERGLDSRFLVVSNLELPNGYAFLL